LGGHFRLVQGNSLPGDKKKESETRGGRKRREREAIMTIA